MSGIHMMMIGANSIILSSGSVTIGNSGDFYGYRGPQVVGSISVTQGPALSQFYVYNLSGGEFAQFSTTGAALSGDPATITMTIQGGPVVSLTRSSAGVYLSGTPVVDYFNFISRLGQTLTFYVEAP